MKRLLLAASLTFPLLAQAGADISIGTMYDYLDGDKSTLLKRVRNSGDASAFVRVSVAELIYDASGKAREVSIDIPNGSGMETRVLVASPARLIVPSGGMQALRILYMGERNKERYFRLRFEPVLPQQDDGFGLTQAQSEQYRESLSAGVNILAGYGSLLFVRPENRTTPRRSSARPSVFWSGTTATAAWCSTTSTTAPATANSARCRASITSCPTACAPSSARPDTCITST